MNTTSKQQLAWSAGSIVVMGLLIVAIVKLSGCSIDTTTSLPIEDGDDPNKHNIVKNDGGDNGDSILDIEDDKPKEAILIPEAPPEELYEPVVVLSEGHSKSCLVKVGDKLPEISLPDLEGNEKPLQELYGDKLTVVVFWNSKYALSFGQFIRLGEDVVEEFAEYGVSLVTINVGDSKGQVQAMAEEANCNWVCLLDAEEEAMQMVATEKLPRTYVLDAEGTIRWFDIEYSRGMERELRNAIYYLLRQSNGAGESVGG